MHPLSTRFLTARNVAVYLVGVGAAVAGALGVVHAVDIPWIGSLVLLVLGLGIVVGVHQYLGGPVPSNGPV